MNHARYLCLIVSIGIILFFQMNCGKKNATAIQPSQKIIYSEFTHLTSAVVPSAGENLVINKPNDPLHGLSVEIPENAYKDTRTYRLSSAAILSHQFGALLHPITPLIKIENGGGYTNEIIKLKIPCTIPHDFHAMAFLYDPQSGELEAMPALGHDSVSITVLTRNFDQSTIRKAKERINDGSYPYLSGATSEPSASKEVSYSLIFVSSIVVSELEKECGSSFTPGVDDWHFQNLGSYIEPGGHSAGQSITMLWYNVMYHEANSSKLFSRYHTDTTQRNSTYIRQEDDKDYKLCSVVQKDQKNDIVKICRPILHESGSLHDNETYLNFAHAILVTHHPQFVFMQSSDKSSILTLVVYKAAHNELDVADPNFPGDRTRMIRFKSESFTPYETGENVNNLKLKYPTVLFAGQSQLIDWFKIENRWIELNNGTIGDGLFPAFQLQALDVQKRFTDFDYHTFKSVTPLTFRVFGSSFRPKVEGVCDEDGKRIQMMHNTIPLLPGKHLYGFTITDERNAWVGSHWVEIRCVKDTAYYTRTCTPDITINGNRIIVKSAHTDIDPQNTLFYLDVKFDDPVFDNIIVRLEYYGGEGKYPFTENASEGKGSYVMFQPMKRPQYNVHCSGSGELNILKDDDRTVEGNFTCTPKCKFNDENYTIKGKFIIPK